MTGTRALEQAQDMEDKAPQDLDTPLRLFTEKPAQRLVLKHENETRIGGNAQKVWQELESKSLQAKDEVIRAKLAELPATSMKGGQDPDGYCMETIFNRNDATEMG